MDALNIEKIATYSVFAVILVPSVAFTSKKVSTWMTPKLRRPLAWISAGAFFLALGLGCIYLTLSAVQSGTVQCGRRGCTYLMSPFCIGSFSSDGGGSVSSIRE